MKKTSRKKHIPKIDKVNYIIKNYIIKNKIKKIGMKIE